VKKDEYPETKIEDNDKIEIVHFVGGGLINLHFLFYQERVKRQSV